ncbi:hypothetical protein [Mycobacterium marinum]|nr:hypothetical protein [Mycobacterium marinum]
MKITIEITIDAADLAATITPRTATPAKARLLRYVRKQPNNERKIRD